MICPTGEANYFLRQGWTRHSLICPSGNHGVFDAQAWRRSKLHLYSITPMPSALAVLRLMTSILVGRSTGRPEYERVPIDAVHLRSVAKPSGTFLLKRARFNLASVQGSPLASL
jgi:hypothetical protein